MVVTYGEALVDLIEQADGSFAAILGGSVANFTLAVARQGMAATYLNRLSDDIFGQRFARHLGDAGIVLAAPRSALPTSLAVVALDAHKVPSYAFHRDGVADRDGSSAAAVSLLPTEVALFHTGGLALVPQDIDATLAVAAAAAANGALVSVDANVRPPAVADLPRYAAGVRRALALAQVVKVSEEDLLYLGCGGADPVGAARTLFDYPAVQLIALTLGGQGAMLLTRQATVALPVPPGVVVVDTVGAGDCFQAGLVASLHGAGPLDGLAPPRLIAALRHALATASINVMRAGCNPPLRADVERFLAMQGDWT